jgi:hypothetical protein
MSQLALSLDAPADTAKRGCREAIRRILTGERGRRWTLYGLQDEVARITKRYYSPTTISAKLRDLRKTAHGALDVRCEHVAGTVGVWEAWLP